jgi:thioredoxin 1
MIELNEKTFHETITSTEGVSVVQFTAPWCGPCRMLAPRLQELSEDLSVNYFKVNIDENTELARNFQIMSIPTLQFYKDGELVKTVVGIRAYGELVEIVEGL